MIGTVVEVVGVTVVVEWDDDDGPQEDEVNELHIRHAPAAVRD